MILIADSGSSKTDWRVIGQNGNIRAIKTEGINPYYQTSYQITELLSQSLFHELTVPITEIYFYGAGCSSKQNQDILAGVFKRQFPQASIFVSHDLFGAARALCGHKAGIACILGTGSNSCLYDGKVIINNLPSLGYALGDEGSGSWLGKRLIAQYFSKSLSSTLRNMMREELVMDIDVILEKTYKQPMPSKFLASYSPFIYHNLEQPEIRNLVYESFECFIKQTIMKYEGYQSLPVNFTGSIAYFYQDILKEAAAANGVMINAIDQSPIEGLTLFHNKSIS